MMGGRSNCFGGVREDNRKLLAKEIENEAVSRELDRVPNGVAPDAGRLFDLAGSLDEAHGQACRDRREDAGTVEVLGHEIGSERDQKADPDLGAALLAIVPADPGLSACDAPGNARAHGDAAECAPREVEVGILDREDRKWVG